MCHLVVGGRDAGIHKPIHKRLGASPGAVDKFGSRLRVPAVWFLVSESQIPIEIAIGFSFMLIAIVNDVLPRIFLPQRDPSGHTRPSRDFFLVLIHARCYKANRFDTLSWQRFVVFLVRLR